MTQPATKPKPEGQCPEHKLDWERIEFTGREGNLVSYWGCPHRGCKQRPPRPGGGGGGGRGYGKSQEEIASIERQQFLIQSREAANTLIGMNTTVESYIETWHKLYQAAASFGTTGPIVASRPTPTPALTPAPPTTTQSPQAPPAPVLAQPGPSQAQAVPSTRQEFWEAVKAWYKSVALALADIGVQDVPGLSWGSAYLEVLAKRGVKV